VVNGTLTIDAEVRITNGAVFYFRKNAGVLVQAAGSLIMDDVTFDASARPINDVSCLWNGVVLEAGGSGSRLISTNSLIKFAKIGVLSKEGGARYRLVRTHFLDNIEGLRVEKYQAGVQHPGIYRGCTFEIDSLNLTDVTYGIRVWDNNNIRLGEAECPLFDLDVNNGNFLFSKFINLDFGIWGRRTSAKVVWNRFYDIHEAGIRIVGHEIEELEDPVTGQLIDYVEQWSIGDNLKPTDLDPMGINSVCYRAWYYSVDRELDPLLCLEHGQNQLIANTFQNCKNGVWSTASTRIWMRQNFFENSEEYAVTVEGSKKNSSWEAMHNYVRGCENGFRGYNNFNMRMEIDTNCFETPLVGGVPMNEEQFLVRTAVHISQTLYPPVGIKNTTRISDNTINRYPTAVSVSTRRNVFVERNEVRVPKYSLFQGSTYGVRLTNVQGDTLRCNRIVVEGTQDVSGYTNGIALTASPHSLVEENKIEYVSNSLVAESGNFDSHIWTNVFRGFQRGVFLKGANAIVGRQFRSTGSNMLPQDNEFLEIPAAPFVSSQACIFNESLQIPPIGQSYAWDVRLPVGSIWYPVAITSGFSNGLTSINLVSGAAFPLYSVCSDTQPGPPQPGKNEADAIHLSDSIRLWLLEAVVEASNPLHYTMVDGEAIQIFDRNKEEVYRSLYEKDVDVSQFSVLDSLKSMFDGALVEKMIETDYMLTSQLESAGLDISMPTWTYSDPAHKRYNRFIEIEDRVLWDSSVVYPYSVAETDSLVGWASLCPDVYGTFVYRTRSLLDFWGISYVPCVSLGSVQMKSVYANGAQRVEDLECPMLIYPNPGQSNIHVQICGEGGKLSISDILGRVLISEWVAANQEEWLGYVENWNEGVYSVRFESNSGVVHSALFIKN